jgi:ATP-dependent Lhr-like helicase
MPPADPWHIVAQQALTTTLEYGRLPFHELLTGLQGAFRELSAGDISRLLDHMVDRNYLERAEDVVQVGPLTEQEFGRGHYRDLMASFSGTLLLTGKHGNAEIGFIDPSVLTGTSDRTLLLLGGRSWNVTGVEWSKRTVWLEPASHGGKARWTGSARSLGPHVCGGIRSVLATGASTSVTVSLRSKANLIALREQFSITEGQHFTISRVDGGADRTWTFAGTRENRTLARQASIGGDKVRFDALSVQAAVSQHSSEHFEPLTEVELAQFAEAIKFAACVPSALLERTILARNFAPPV